MRSTHYLGVLFYIQEFILSCPGQNESDRSSNIPQILPVNRCKVNRNMGVFFFLLSCFVLLFKLLTQKVDKLTAEGCSTNIHSQTCGI